jgi:hypothetical protein
MPVRPLPPAALGQLAFLAGHWRGELGGGAIDEVWLPPRVDVAQGMVQLVVDGRIATIELILIAAEADRVVMRYHHFDPDYRAWEDDGPIALTLTEAGGGTAVFTNLAPSPRHALEMGYRASGADALESWVIVIKHDGATERIESRFIRVQAQP